MDVEQTLQDRPKMWSTAVNVFSTLWISSQCPGTGSKPSHRQGWLLQTLGLYHVVWILGQLRGRRYFPSGFCGNPCREAVRAAGRGQQQHPPWEPRHPPAQPRAELSPPHALELTLHSSMEGSHVVCSHSCGSLSYKAKNTNHITSEAQKSSKDLC